MKELKSFVNAICTLGLVFQSQALASTQATSEKVASNPNLNSPTDGALLPMLMALIGIVIFIYLIAWAAKKLNLTPNHGQHIKTVTSMSLGGRERIVIIEVQNQQYAIGVTPHSVSTLFKLDENISVKAFSRPDNKVLNKLTELLNNDLSKVNKSNS